ncbi:DUF2306 domain-containing protein [Camelimonas abortus]|uniref:DUF2306 domain-containing protein n=1 Tax=Camelimonas abortus TaxID=1017184 RepID=A0ABV7LGN3_9HYPH
MTSLPLLQAAPVIQLHACCALAATALGAVVLLRRKGDAAHRLLGRAWVVLMAMTALSALFIWELRTWGRWSPIHLLSLVTSAVLVYAVVMARRGRLAAHRRAMRGLYVLALPVTGYFTLLPGRLMHETLFGGGRAWAGAAVVAVVSAGFAALAVALRRQGRRADAAAPRPAAGGSAAVADRDRKGD